MPTSSWVLRHFETTYITFNLHKEPFNIVSEYQSPPNSMYADHYHRVFDLNIPVSIAGILKAKHMAWHQNKRVWGHTVQVRWIEQYHRARPCRAHILSPKSKPAHVRCSRHRAVKRCRSSHWHLFGGGAIVWLQPSAPNTGRRRGNPTSSVSLLDELGVFLSANRVEYWSVACHHQRYRAWVVSQTRYSRHTVTCRYGYPYSVGHWRRHNNTNNNSSLF